MGASEPGYAFTGREWDPETGLYYYRARYYDPNAGRFISEDPIGFDGGVNFYSYVLNRPTRFVDPFGLDIAVIENGPTSGNPIGHTAIAVTGAGVFSYGNGYPVGGSMSDYVLREGARRNTHVWIIKTSPAQDAKALEYLRSFPNSTLPSGFWSGLFLDNCSTRSNRALDAADIEYGYPSKAVGDMPRFLPGVAGARANGVAANLVRVPQGTTAVPTALLPFNP